MKCYCTKCGVNWSRLLTCDMDEDEQVEVCPLCLTDRYLEEGKQGENYFRCAVTGDVIESGTKKKLRIYYPVAECYMSKDLPAMTETKTRHEEREDKALEEYFKSGNPEDYHKAFRN